jgi:hypothetical protein
MTDCSHVETLLDIYVDDETSAETNALVQAHVARCPSCARRLQLLRGHRGEVRAALRERRAPAELHERIRASLPAADRLSVAAFVRNWLVPAAATALVAWIVIPERRAEPDVYAAMAVEEHRACALAGAVRPRPASAYAPDSRMPLLPDAKGEVRVIAAHACGQAMDFTHLIVEAPGGRKASILISRASEGGERRLQTQTRGEFEVSQTRTTRHVASVVMDRAQSEALRAWREPAMRRVQQFLRQLEGT